MTGLEEMVSKLQRIERELSRKKGPFALFGLFLREDVSDRWDLLVAAPWMEGREVEAVRLIASKLTKELETEELLRISRDYSSVYQGPRGEENHFGHTCGAWKH